MAAANTRNSSGSSHSFVLIVDSQPRSLIFTSMMVQRLGYHACSALGVGSALEITGASEPSLILAELRLKGLNGLDLLQRLRRKPNAVPMVIMTSDLTPEIEWQCREAGAAACLGKPLQASDVFRVIHPLIEHGTRRRDVRIETRLSVTVNNRTLECMEGECATNLSVNGLYLRTRVSYPVNSLVLIRLTINEEQIEAEAVVAHCRQPEDVWAGMWGVGLKFVTTSPGAAEVIRSFINEEVTHGMDAASHGLIGPEEFLP